jgi:hypothetical protein
MRPAGGEEEGVIKFGLAFRRAGPLDWAGVAALDAWRQVLFRLGLTGLDPARYGGLAYGNVSLRAGARRFIVSGTQTGGKPALGPGDYCLVLDFDLAENRLCAEGPVEPSSEALTHGAVYEAVPRVGCVLHVHSPEVWRNAGRLGLRQTGAAIAYGTPEMGWAVAEAVAGRGAGVVAMGGHEDGVLAFAGCPAQAAARLLRCLARALELDRRAEVLAGGQAG